MTNPPEYHLEPETAPDWAFSPEHDIKCPECDTKTSGLNWKLKDEVVTSMVLVPCGHELPISTWELAYSGRDRQLGTIIRTPKFVRIDGS